MVVTASLSEALDPSNPPARSWHSLLLLGVWLFLLELWPFSTDGMALIDTISPSPVAAGVYSRRKT